MTRAITHPRLRIAGAALVSALLAIALHAAFPTLRYPNPSQVPAGSPLFIALAATLLAITYIVLGIVFRDVEGGLPGPGWRKGLRFAAAFTPVWVCGVLFMSVHEGSSFTQELFTSAADVPALLLLGLVLGKLLGTEPSPGGGRAAGPGATAVLLTVLVWLAVRYGLQRWMLGFLARPAMGGTAVLAWEVAMGVSLGLLQVGVGRGRRQRGPLGHALWFAGFVFGPFYLVSGIFAPLFVRLDWFEFLCSMAIDVLTVLAAAYLHGAIMSAHGRSRSNPR